MSQEGQGAVGSCFGRRWRRKGKGYSSPPYPPLGGPRKELGYHKDPSIRILPSWDPGSSVLLSYIVGPSYIGDANAITNANQYKWKNKWSFHQIVWWNNSAEHALVYQNDSLSNRSPNYISPSIIDIIVIAIAIPNYCICNRHIQSLKLQLKTLGNSSSQNGWRVT